MFAYVVLIAILSLSSGTKVLFPDGKIIAGEATTIEEFPYIVSIQYADYHVCGGAILDKDTILTAAQCVNDYSEQFIKIRAGSTNNSEGGVLINVRNYTTHKDYDQWNYNYDIALVKLDTPLEFSNTIQPIAIPNTEKVIDEGTEMVVSGWGITGIDGPSVEKILRKVNVSTITNERCKEFLTPRYVDITDQMICADVPETGKDSCLGDSGGPMVGEGPLLLGIVSVKITCGDFNFPGVYANVTNFISWINDNR